MDELSSSDVSVIEDDSLDRWKGPTLVEPYLKEATFEELCNDDVLVRAALSTGLIDSIYITPLELGPISSPFLPTIPCLHAFYESVGDIKGYNASFDPYT